MDKIIEQMRFGFEIEGNFKSGLPQSLNYQGKFVSDGSVGGLSPEWETEIIPRSIICPNCTRHQSGAIVQYCSEHHTIYHREGQTSTEYNSKIFDDLPSVLEALKQFNSKTYIFNQTCGLHFHISLNEGHKKLYGAISNQKYLTQLFQEALSWCPCQKERLQRSGTYCKNYEHGLALIKAMRNSDAKYRFVRFHPTYKTLEFRFLCPCEHKIKNVTKLLNSLTAYLSRSESEHQFVSVEVDSEPRKLEINKVLFPGKMFACLRGLHGTAEPYHYITSTEGFTPKEIDYVNVLNRSKLEDKRKISEKVISGYREPFSQRYTGTDNLTWR